MCLYSLRVAPWFLTRPLHVSLWYTDVLQKWLQRFTAYDPDSLVQLVCRCDELHTKSCIYSPV